MKTHVVVMIQMKKCHHVIVTKKAVAQNRVVVAQQIMDIAVQIQYLLPNICWKKPFLKR